MIIYRLLGRTALWPNCGTNMCEPLTSSNLTEFRKQINKMRKQYEKDGVEYRLTLQKLTLLGTTKELMLELFAEDSPEALIKHTQSLNRWEYQP